MLLDRFEEGVALFNSGHYFECHDAWEDVWREMGGREKIFVQALIQVAVALHHGTHQNARGAHSLLERASATLREFGPEFAGVNVKALLTAAERWKEALASEAAVPQLPTLLVTRPEMLESLFP